MASSMDHQFQYSRMAKVMESDDHVSAGFEVVFRGSGDDIDDNDTAIVRESDHGAYSRTSGKH